MLNIMCKCVRPSTVTIFNGRPPAAVVQRLRFYASFTLREVLHETSDETGTLITRFAKHIALERYNGDRLLVPTTIRYADFFPITDEHYFKRELSKTVADQLPALIILASSYRSNAQPKKYVYMLNELDNAAMLHLKEMSMDIVLETLYSFLFLIPNWLTRLDFYHAAVERLVTQDFNNKATKEAFVQLCFYMGLHKKNARTVIYLEEFLKKHLNTYLPQLSDLDLALVCNAAYKASIVHSEHTAYEERLIDAILRLPVECANDALLITYIKSLRLQRVKSESVCLHLAEFCKQPNLLAKLQLRGLAHIFAYFVEQQWDNSVCIKAITDHLFKQLKFEKSQSILRPKDLATFLWCMAQFNCKVNEQELDRFEQLVNQMLDYNEYRYYPDNLVDTCLSLWMLGKQSRDLINAAVELKSAAQNRSQRAQPKVDSRLTVLLSAVKIEQPEWAKNFGSTNAFNKNGKVPAHLIKSHAHLAQLAEQLSKEQDITSAKLICPINGINIPSLLLKRSDESELYVEMLDESLRLKFSQAPSALIRLKTRLLEASGCRVIQLPATEDYDKVKQLLFNNSEESGSDSEDIARSSISTQQ